MLAWVSIYLVVGLVPSYAACSMPLTFLAVGDQQGCDRDTRLERYP